MSDAWWTVVLVGVATIAIKGAGPVLLGGKPLPPRLGRVIGLLAPALLAALVAISTFVAGARSSSTNARSASAAAGVAVALQGPAVRGRDRGRGVTALARAVVSCRVRTR